MAQVEVEQAVFTSCANGSVQGYQLVSRSPGIDERVAQALRQWSPTHNGLESADKDACSINFFPIDKKRVAIGRTLFGLSEYSSRGSLQTVTLYLVTSLDHLMAFNGDAWVMASIARSIGLLRFDRNISAKLPTALMPSSTILGATPVTCSDKQAAEQSIELMNRGRQVAVVGVDNPTPILRLIIHQLNIQQRLAMSFATGLQHSCQRKFQLEFHKSASTDLRYSLSQDNISIVQPEKRVAAAPRSPVFY